MQEKGNVLVFSPYPSRPLEINDLPTNFKQSGQVLTKTKKGLFLNQLGTGRIYQLELEKNEYRWNRIDSTFYTGYNFGSLFFSVDSTLYSFGGGGLFNFNGNLRYFNNNIREWDAVRLSHSILWNSTEALFTLIDTDENKLIVQALPLESDQQLKNRQVDELKQTIWELDIAKGKWTMVGKVNFDNSLVLAQTPLGALVNMDKVVDFKNNKIYSVSINLQSKLFKLFGTSTLPIKVAYTFCIDSTYFVGDLENYIDSVVISRKDLIDMGTAFYKPVKPSSPINQREYLIGGIVVLAIVSMYILYRKTKPRISKTTIAAIGSPIEQSKTEKEKNETHVVFRSGKLMELLNERERLLLDFIYKHSLDERLTTIEEINKVIGASQRNSEVQKRLRSDIIGAVNDKLEIVSESKYNIIDKQRSDFDKRSFEYFIRPEHMELVEKVLGKKS